MYADDTTLYSNINSPNQNNIIRLTETKINTELANVDEWAEFILEVRHRIIICAIYIVVVQLEFS